MNLSVPAPYGGKQKCYFFKIALSFKPPALNSFWLISIEYIHLQDFELTVQAALGIFNQTANGLITLTARKRISLLASSDQMAPPFGNLQAFREKGLT